MIKKIAVLLVLAGATGCQNVKHALFPGDPGKPGTDASSVCRATPALLTRDVDFPADARLTDNTSVFTGYENGSEGVTESVTLCKRDVHNALVNCQTAGGSGMLSDGTDIEFVGTSVTIRLAVSNGYANAVVRLDYTCHG